MKYRMIAMMLALWATAWAQTATQNPTPQQSTAPSTKAECACCDKADAKDAKSCCAHYDVNGNNPKEPMSCCGKDAKSCCGENDGMSCKRTDKDKTVAICGDCMKNHGKACCVTAKRGNGKSGMNCCKEHCTAHVSMGAGS